SGDNGHTSADEIGHKGRQTVVLALQPVVLHCHVLALDVADFAEALPKRRRAGRGGIGRHEVNEANDRHRGLLRVHYKRPRSPCAAKQHDEVAAPHRGLTRKAKDHGPKYSRSSVACVATKSGASCPLRVIRVGFGRARMSGYFRFGPKATLCHQATNLPLSAKS